MNVSVGLLHQRKVDTAKFVYFQVYYNAFDGRRTSNAIQGEKETKRPVIYKERT